MAKTKIAEKLTRHLSIKSVLVEVTLIVIFLILILLAMLYYSLKVQTRVIDQLFYLNKLDLMINETEREQLVIFKDYDKYFSSQEFSDFQKRLEKLRISLNKILQYKLYKNISYDENLVNDFNQYFTDLQTVITLNYKIYSPSSGKKSILESILNQIRWNHLYQQEPYASFNAQLFKNYGLLMRGEISIAQFTEIFKKIVSNVKKYKPVSKVDQLVKVRYLLIINDFYNTLVDYLTLKEQYGEPFNSGAFAKLNSDVVFLKHDMEELSLYVREVIISKQKKIIILVIVFSVIILFVLFLYLVFFYRSLKESISHIQEAMERLLQGDIRDIEPVFFSKELFLFSLQYRKHLAHLRTKKEIIDKFAQGEYDIEIEKLSAYDQIGNSLEALKSSLLSRQEEIASTHRSEEIQRWITEGLANLGEIIRESQENLDTLYQVALKNLLEYLDSPMGAYYEQVKENDEIILKLRVAYAYDKKRMPQVSYKLAEGFIGTVAAEKQRLLLNKVPDNYIFFETAFGVAKPKALIFVPVINRNNVLGVFEIAKNDQFNEHEIELIERFAEDFGVTVVFVSNAEQNRQKIQNLEHQIQQLLEQQKQYQQKLEQLQEQNRKIKEQYEQYRLSLRTKEQIIMEKVDENFRLREEIKKKEEQIKQIMSDFEKIEQKYKERIEILEKQIENLLEQLEQNKNNKQDDDNEQD